MRYTVRGSSLAGYGEMARSLGLDPSAMLAGAGLPPTCLDDPDIRIPVNGVRRLFEASAAAARIDDFGLRLAATRKLSVLGPLELIVREQPTVRKAIEAIIRHVRQHNDSLLVRIEETDGMVIISPLLIGRAPARQATELTIGMLYRILRLLLGDAWRPQSVCFMHGAPRNLDAYRRIFRARVEFSCDFNGVICATHDLDVPIPPPGPTMAPHVLEHIASIAAHGNVTTAEKVRELVWMLLASGQCSVEQVADHLGVDRRTVHRRLARQGETFSGLVNAVRKDMATHYVATSDRPLYVVAELLGFSALSVFSRWFRTNFGCSVSAWRAANTTKPALRPAAAA